MMYKLVDGNELVKPESHKLITNSYVKPLCPTQCLAVDCQRNHTVLNGHKAPNTPCICHAKMLHYTRDPSEC